MTSGLTTLQAGAGLPRQPVAHLMICSALLGPGAVVNWNVVFATGLVEMMEPAPSPALSTDQKLPEGL